MTINIKSCGQRQFHKVSRPESLLSFIAYCQSNGAFRTQTRDIPVTYRSRKSYISWDIADLLAWEFMEWRPSLDYTTRPTLHTKAYNEARDMAYVEQFERAYQ